MRFLHTADWHVGKKLGRIDRCAEYEAVLDEVVQVAIDQKVDVVLVAGDLFDRAAAPLESVGLVIDALLRLADGGRQVIAMPGNHDSPQLFEILGRLLEPRGIHFVPKIVRAESGGVVKVASLDGKQTASVGVFPFLHEAQVVDFMADVEDWYKGYAQKIRLIASSLCEGFEPGSVGILMGHWFVDGSQIGGDERQIHLGQQYAATTHSIPPGASYVALGHIHRPQQIPGAAVQSWYSGSLLQLDFGEIHDKGVIVIEANPGTPAKPEFIPITSARKLIRVEDTIDSLRARVDEFGNAYLDVRVTTDGPVFGLSDEIREFLPNAVIVQAVYEKGAEPEVAIEDRSIAEAYKDFHASLRGHGVIAPDALIATLIELEEEVDRAPA